MVIRSGERRAQIVKSGSLAVDLYGSAVRHAHRQLAGCSILLSALTNTAVLAILADWRSPAIAGSARIPLEGRAGGLTNPKYYIQ